MKRSSRSVVTHLAWSAVSFFALSSHGLAGQEAKGNSTHEDVSYGGLIRAFWGMSDDTIVTLGDPVASVLLDEAQVFTEFTRGTMLIRTQLELSSGTARLEDGYIAFRAGDSLGVRVGQFKPRILHSASANPETLVFRDRTILGERFDFYDHGVEVSGAQDPFRWFVSLVNGPDGQEDGYFSAGRVEWASYESELGLAEGARGAPDYLICDVGLFGFFDSATKSSVFDAGGYGIDLTLTLGPWYAHTEFTHLEKFFPASPVSVHGNPTLVLAPDSSPLSMTFGHRIGEEWVANARWERADDVPHTDHYAFALNHFPGNGSLMITGDVSYYETRGPQGLVFSLGMTIGANRPSHVREY